MIGRVNVREIVANITESWGNYLICRRRKREKWTKRKWWRQIELEWLEIDWGERWESRVKYWSSNGLLNVYALLQAIACCCKWCVCTGIWRTEHIMQKIHCTDRSDNSWILSLKGYFTQMRKKYILKFLCPAYNNGGSGDMIYFEVLISLKNYKI